MKTKKATAAQQATATTAKEKKNSAKRTVKNTQKATAPADPQEEAKKNRRSAAAKKAAETRRQNREEEARRMEEEKKRLQEEEKQRQAAENKRMKEEGREAKKTHTAQYQKAKKEVKEGRTALYIFHLLNRLATGKDQDTTGVNMVALQWCYEDAQNITAVEGRSYTGFSFNTVKVDSRGRICKMVKAAGDEEIIFNKYGIIRANARTAQDVDIIEHYQGKFLLIPVKVDEAGILTAAQSVTAIYKDTYNDARNIYRTKTTRNAMREAAEKRHRNAMKEAAEKAEREAMKAQAAAALEVARQEAETADTVEIPRTTARRSWWRNIAASLF